MSRCPDKAFLTVGGRRVAALRCQLDAGHKARSIIPLSCLLGIDKGPWPGFSHSFTLEWDDGETLPDLPEPDLYDPDERFDVPVEVLTDDELEQAARHADTDRQVDAHREARGES